LLPIILLTASAAVVDLLTPLTLLSSIVLTTFKCAMSELEVRVVLERHVEQDFELVSEIWKLSLIVKRVVKAKSNAR